MELNVSLQKQMKPVKVKEEVLSDNEPVRVKEEILSDNVSSI